MILMLLSKNGMEGFENLKDAFDLCIGCNDAL
jgi:hypothetical protein